MKGKRIAVLLLWTVIWLLAGGRSFAEQTHSISFFYENVCASCNKEEEFFELFNRCISPEEKEQLSYEIRTYNLFLDSDRSVYEKLLADAGKEKSEVTLPLLVADGQWLCGYEAMEAELHGILVEGKRADAPIEETAASPETELAETTGIPEIIADNGETAILLFTTYSCEECAQIKEYLKTLQEQKEFSVTEVSIAQGDSVQIFKELLKEYGRAEEEGKVPAVFTGDTALLGGEEIRESLEELLEKEASRSIYLKERLEKLEPAETEAVQRADMLTLFGAGLLAGLNPCSISMLLMLFSILLASHASVLKNGLLYLLGKYLTYFGLGFGICFAASKVDGAFLERFGKVLNGVIVILFLAAAVLNFLDFLNVRKDDYGKVRMQLPKGLRRFNHQLLKKADGVEGAFLALLVLGLGIAVSLGEFFCTGQIYMASLLYLLRNEREQLFALMGSLLVYVTAMSIPAMVILGIIAKTKGAGAVSDFMLKHLGAIKLLNCGLFVAFAVYFLLSIF
ncbi:MAG: hypothetical protein SOZ59_02035 [Candidatus Limivivens sp.]|nr:hypothetical protein [Candidatus Limivivens sp.]